MTRLPLIEPEEAKGAVRELLDELRARGRDVGPMVRGMANSSALLRAYVDLSRAMKRSHIDPRVTERVSLAQQEWIGCAYCVEAHARAALALGLDETDVQLARQGTATDAKTAALVAFGQQVVAAPAEVSDADISRLRALGWREEQIAEIAGLAALNLMTGAFNLVAGIHPAASSA